MKVVDPGHVYELGCLDGERGLGQQLVFVKREGPGYPGNVGAHAGTTMQEVLRALIERSEYVNSQVRCAETEAATELMKGALLLFELRAARRHGRYLDCPLNEIVAAAGCSACGHVGCEEHKEVT